MKALSIKTEINQIFSSFFSRGQFPIWHHCISGTFHLQYTANFKLKSVAVSVTLLVRGKVWLVSLVQRVKIFWENMGLSDIREKPFNIKRDDVVFERTEALILLTDRPSITKTAKIRLTLVPAHPLCVIRKTLKTAMKILKAEAILITLLPVARKYFDLFRCSWCWTTQKRTKERRRIDRFSFRSLRLPFWTDRSCCVIFCGKSRRWQDVIEMPAFTLGKKTQNLLGANLGMPKRNLRKFSSSALSNFGP